MSEDEIDLRDFTLDPHQILVSSVRLYKIVEELEILDKELRGPLLTGSHIPILAKVLSIKNELKEIIVEAKWDEDEQTSEI